MAKSLTLKEFCFDKRQQRLVYGAAYAFFGVLSLVLALLPRQLPVDFLVFLEGARRYQTGELLYGEYLIPFLGEERNLPYLYPPLLAFLMQPLLLIPWQWAYLVWSAASVAAYLSAHTIFRALHAEEWRLSCAVLFLWLLFAPVWSSLRFGQINLIVLLALVVGCWASLRDRPFLSGVALGAAAWLKVTPALLLFALPAGQRLKGIGGFIAVSLIAWLVAIGREGDYELLCSFLATSSRIAQGELFPESLFNYALAPALQAIVPFMRAVSPLWLQWGIVVGIVGVTARMCYRGDTDPAIALPLLICPMLLISPLLWIHHAVWLLLPVGVAVMRAQQTRTRLFVFAAYAVLHLVARYETTLGTTLFVWVPAARLLPASAVITVWYALSREHAPTVA